MKEKFLGNASKTICTYYDQIKNLVLKSDTDIYEQINKSMLTLKKKKRGVVWLEPNRNIMKVYFTKGKYKTSYYEVFPDGWGGYPYIKVKSDQFDLKAIQMLVDQAINKVNNVIAK